MVIMLFNVNFNISVAGILREPLHLSILSQNSLTISQNILSKPPSALPQSILETMVSAKRIMYPIKMKINDPLKKLAKLWIEPVTQFYQPIWLVVLGFHAILTAKVISWRSVTHMCFLTFSHQY